MNNKQEFTMTNKTKLILASLSGLLIIGIGAHQYTYANTKISNDKAQVIAIKKAISDTNARNKAITEKNKSANSSTTKSTETDVLKTTQDNMNTAASVTLNYIKAMENAKSTDAIKTINKTYLSSNAALPVIVGGGDDGKISNNIFGGDTNAIHTIASMPNSNKQIKVYAYSDASQKIGFTAVYDLGQQKIIETNTYDVSK